MTAEQQATEYPLAHAEEATMSTAAAVEKIYQAFDGPGVAWDYHERHGTMTMNILTIESPRQAVEAVATFKDAIAGKTVIEIGAGVGYLAMEMAKHAKFVWAVEVDPAWTWTYMKYLYANKPENLTWVFGSAECLVGKVFADVAVMRTRSGIRELVAMAERLAPTIVLSLCETPVVANRGDDILREVTEYVEHRTAELLAECAANGGCL